MKRPEFIARQAGNPTGPIGTILARIMEKETVPENNQALSLLHIESDDRVLEIGSGHGATLKIAADIAYEGFVAGIDISDVMVRRAEKVNGSSIKTGRVEVFLASSDNIPYPDETFNKALAVHTIYFWDQPKAHFSEVYRTLVPDGKFSICFRPAEDAGFAKSFPSSVYHIRQKDDVLTAMRQVGFKITNVTTENGARGDLVFAIGQKPARR